MFQRRSSRASRQQSLFGASDNFPHGFHEALQSLCYFAKDANGNLKKLGPERFQYISTYLAILDRCDYLRRRDDCYCRRPRIYAILENIGAKNYMGDFVTADIKDISLPFSYETLPGFLKDEDIRRSFLQYQTCVLTDARKLEFSEDHIHFQETAEEHVSERDLQRHLCTE